MRQTTIFITATDTGAGKTIFTGLLARTLKQYGYSVITQKTVQTGSEILSDDIKTHRMLMGEQINDYDTEFVTCPYVFRFPSSPHLSASLENKTVDVERIYKSTLILEEHFDYVLIEGTGGLHVPLKPDLLLSDYIKDRNYPVFLVTHSRLGSINHTLLSLEAIKQRDIKLLGIALNSFNPENNIIYNDTKQVILEYLEKMYPRAALFEIPAVSPDDRFIFPAGMVRLINEGKNAGT